MSAFTILFILLLLAWIFGFGLFHVAGASIHLLLVAAVVMLILHFVRGTLAGNHVRRR
jgi:multisubunit Na+/H+ antiporter MnhE subunit